MDGSPGLSIEKINRGNPSVVVKHAVALRKSPPSLRPAPFNYERKIMKKKKSKKSSTVIISIHPSIREAGERIAKKKGRTVNNYFAYLITEEVCRVGVLLPDPRKEAISGKN